MRLHHLIFFFALLLFFSCKEKANEKLSPETIKKIQADIHKRKEKEAVTISQKAVANVVKRYYVDGENIQHYRNNALLAENAFQDIDVSQCPISYQAMFKEISIASKELTVTLNEVPSNYGELFNHWDRQVENETWDFTGHKSLEEVEQKRIQLVQLIENLEKLSKLLTVDLSKFGT